MTTTPSPIIARYSTLGARRRRIRLTTAGKIILIVPGAIASAGIAAAIGIGAWQGVTTPPPSAHHAPASMTPAVAVENAESYCAPVKADPARWRGCMADLIEQQWMETMP